MMALPDDAHDNHDVEFLTAVLGDPPDGPLSLFSINADDGTRHTDWADTPTGLYQAALRRAPTCNVWFGVAPRFARTGGRGTAQDCTTFGALWADLDVIGPGHARTDLIPTTGHALDLVEEFPLPTSAVLATGGGLQVWWFLTERLPVDEAADVLARFGAWWVQAGGRHGWHIDNVWDPARVLRVPGTQNRKTGDVAPVELAVWNPDHRYGLDDFEWLPEPPAATYQTAPADRVPYIGPKRPGDHFNAVHSCGQVLETHGWTFDRREPGNGNEHWVRPGKDKRQGSGGTVYAADGHFICWSGSVPELDVRRSYDPFGLYVALRHGGDFGAAGSDLGGRGYGERAVDDSLQWLIDGAGKADGAGAEPVGYHGPPDNELWVEGCDERAWPVIEPAAWRGALGEVVRAIEPHSETDPIALAVELITALGNSIGAGPHAVADGSTHPARLFACLVGKTAKGRKGSAAAQAMRVMAHVDPGWAATRQVNGIASGEALIASVSSPVDPTESDAATVVDHRALIRESEFARFLTIAAREGSTLSAVVRDAWDTGQLSITARTNPVRADGAHVSLCGHITAEELRAKVTASDAANGLLNRFLFALVQRSKRLPSGGSLEEEDYARLGAVLAPIVEQGRKSGRMARTEAAEAYWAKVYNELGDDDPPGMVGQLVARSEPHTLRLSVLFAVLDRRRVVDVCHIEQAYAWWRYFRASVEYLFAGRSFSPDASKLLGALRDAGRDGLSFGEQSGVFGRNRMAGDLAKMRHELTVGGVVVTDERGRDKRSWAVRPVPSTPPTTLLDSSDSSDS